MEQNVREVQDYLKSKILSGEFEIVEVSRDVDRVKVRIDGVVIDVWAWLSLDCVSVVESTEMVFSGEEEDIIKTRFREILRDAKIDRVLGRLEAVKKELAEMGVDAAGERNTEGSLRKCALAESDVELKKSAV
jgi:hypothetical protein